jgi:hypothetical protein
MKWTGTLIVNEHILGSGQHSLVIEQDSRVVGLLTLHDVNRDGVNQLPVMAGSQILSVLGRCDVIGMLRTLGEFKRKEIQHEHQ